LALQGVLISRAMYRNIWNESFPSLCSISFYNANAIKALTVTGFKVDNFIVTEEIIYKDIPFDYVMFRFVKSDGYTVSREVKLNRNKFTDRIHSCVRHENEGFALIDVSNTPMAEVPSLNVASCSRISIGQPIAIMGFHYDRENLTFLQGIISSNVKLEEGKEFLQFNASVRQGFSGSPLINVETGRVVGVVGHRLTSHSKEYDKFKQIIDDNLALLQPALGELKVGPIDPIQVLIASQNQLKQLGRELYKSSHSSFGYAHKIDNLSYYLS